MNEDLKKNLLNLDTLKRLAFMLLFVLILTLVELVVYAVAAFQLLHLLFMGTTQDEIKNFAHHLSLYVYDITKYLTFDSEELPFPFKSWADSETQKPASNKEPEPAAKPDIPEDEIHA